MSNNAKHILLVNGPNLNMLGKREPAVYGHHTLADIEQNLAKQAASLGLSLESVQSNSEAELIERIHAAFQQVDFIIINPAAFTHQSVALRDAILAVDIPFIEVHISNVHKREAFRHHSYFSDVAQGVICGLGIAGYSYALQSAHEFLSKAE
ncbi:type II 3-dehydroquinate dehydratase [Saccharobesus litoralis]|uniref:3-dehydroquinate dehydratase n=1 Tax=Saccharobesus litoralis TaxID=2172099 RepID=A0A2S0VNI0_9ALTE|nr:type II 3-dehydroquinate dehydratase [Saccharobesus litoralis]AWB65732.1 type II 3-dehydroquinate dehydratase [Saccharobesus litoralis]